MDTPMREVISEIEKQTRYTVSEVPRSEGLFEMKQDGVFAGYYKEKEIRKFYKDISVHQGAV